MDIISEILETDRLAEEKLEQAKQERSRMLADCEKAVKRIHDNAESEAGLYRDFLFGEDTSKETAKVLKESEKEQLDALVEAYERCHEEWETEIIAAITG